MFKFPSTRRHNTRARRRHEVPLSSIRGRRLRIASQGKFPRFVWVRCDPASRVTRRFPTSPRRSPASPHAFAHIPAPRIAGRRKPNRTLRWTLRWEPKRRVAC